MILNEELQAVQNGERGAGLKKILNTLIMYGEAFDAERMVKVTGRMGHVVFGSLPVTWIPVSDLLDEILEDGLKSSVKFTADPLSYDPHIPMTIPQKLMFNYIFASQKRLDEQYARLGIVNDRAYTCTCYMPEVGNIPNRGDILSWAESSAVVYANSVLGARCNRNSGIIEHMGQILG